MRLHKFTLDDGSMVQVWAETAEKAFAVLLHKRRGCTVLSVVIDPVVR